MIRSRRENGLWRVQRYRGGRLVDDYGVMGEASYHDLIDLLSL